MLVLISINAITLSSFVHTQSIHDAIELSILHQTAEIFLHVSNSRSLANCLLDLRVQAQRELDYIRLRLNVYNIGFFFVVYIYI